MHYLLDTSAMAKNYIAEQGSADVQRLLDDPLSVIHVSQLVRTEVVSVLARRLREGVLTEIEAGMMIAEYLARQGSYYQVIALAASVQEEAEHLLLHHPLRAADAVHVASGKVVAVALGAAGEDFTFVTADRRQAAAAMAEGLAVVEL
jgi:uncharacterized protein